MAQIIENQSKTYSIVIIWTLAMSFKLRQNFNEGKNEGGWKERRRIGTNLGERGRFLTLCCTDATPTVSWIIARKMLPSASNITRFMMQHLNLKKNYPAATITRKFTTELKYGRLYLQSRSLFRKWSNQGHAAAAPESGMTYNAVLFFFLRRIL